MDFRRFQRRSQRQDTIVETGLCEYSSQLSPIQHTHITGTISHGVSTANQGKTGKEIETLRQMRKNCPRRCPLQTLPQGAGLVDAGSLPFRTCDLPEVRFESESVSQGLNPSSKLCARIEPTTRRQSYELSTCPWYRRVSSMNRC